MPDALLLLQIAVMAVLFAVSYIAVSTVLQSVLPHRVVPLQRIREMLAQNRKHRLLRILLLVPKEETKLDELRGLLAACGIQIDVVNYTAAKRVLAVFCGFMLLGSYIVWKQQPDAGTVYLWLAGIGAFVLVLLNSDKMIWRAVREQRRARIVLDVQVISSQLLYYRSSRLNLHSQLQRCVPLAGYIRKEMQLLVNEWYEGSSEALKRFHRRLAAEEAEDFAETLNALRLYDSERYYELLEERIRTYKEKLALVRDGRKEAASHVLFLVAGVPILYTFLIFIYPWVAESRVLFSSLG